MKDVRQRKSSELLMVADFRANLLKVKSEKNKLSSALKAAEKDIAKFKETQQTLLIENDDLKCKLNV